jgi:glutamate-1-semialdehyde 2,1-aminomutase
MVDRGRLAELLEHERSDYAQRNPLSGKAFASAEHLFGRVPMTWMNMRAGAFPLYLDSARGARVRDLDGHDYVDFSLGDTAAMAGHSPEPVVRAVQRRFGELGGATAMLPTEDAEWVGAELTRRFGLPRWSFALTATDANRWAIRIVRAVTGRPRILVNSYCYHGSVDESLIVVGPDGKARSREGNVGAPYDVTQTSRVAEFNDLEGLERELAHGDVAAVLMEPALTNIGIVLPEDGYLDTVREVTRRHGVLLVIDETHTLCAGPGGATAAWGLEPDLLVVGKPIAGGVPLAAYGMTREVADRLREPMLGHEIDVAGVGGTLTANAMSLAAARAALASSLREEDFAVAIPLAERFTEGVASVIDRHGLPWTVQRLGCRAEYWFCPPPRNGADAAAAIDDELEGFLHLWSLNRGVLLTPFHNMALFSPHHTADDVDLHTEVFAEAVAALVA